MLNILSSLRSTTSSRYEPALASGNIGDTDEANDPVLDFSSSPFEVIESRRQIVHILHGVAESRNPVALASHHLPHNARTRLLGIDREAGKLMIRQLPDETDHAALIQDGQINFFVRHQDSPAMCTLGISGLGKHNGIPCYITPLPEWVLFSQMRDCLRIKTKESINFVLHHSPQDKDQIEAQVIDISEGGIGLLIPHRPIRRVSINDRWHRSTLRSDKEAIGPLELVVRHIGLTATGQQRIGVSIDLGAESTHRRLRQLVMRQQVQPSRMR